MVLVRFWRYLKWIRIRPNDTEPYGSGSETLPTSMIKKILLSMSSLRRIYPATARFDESLGRSSPAPTARVDSTDSATGYSSRTKELRLVYLFIYF